MRPYDEENRWAGGIGITLNWNVHGTATKTTFLRNIAEVTLEKAE